jgi:hypothetical protein
MSTTFATEMTSVIRGVGTGVQAPTTQVLNWIAFALRASTTLLDREADDPAADFRASGGYVIVDRHLTRC